jgi:hypothetical protein
VEEVNEGRSKSGEVRDGGVKKKRDKAQRVEDKLVKRRTEWEEKGKTGEYVGMNRKERRKLEMEKKGTSGAGSGSGKVNEKGSSHPKSVKSGAVPGKKPKTTKKA